MTVPARTRQGLLLLNEVSLAAVTVIAVIGLGRLFDTSSFLPKVVASTIAAHVLAATCRRVRVPPFVTVMVAVVAGALVITWLHLGDTTTGFLPTSETWSTARQQLDDAWRNFGEVVAPAPLLPGFVLAVAAAAWLLAFIADAAAFQAHARLEAVIPGATLFVFGGALGTGRHRLVLSACFLAAVVVHWLTQRLLVKVTATSWLSTATGGSLPALLRVGAGLATVGVAAAALIGPNLPGSSAEAVVPWRATDRDDPGSRVTVSPLVDIRSRIVQQSDVEAFRVRTSTRAYWRLTSLETFNGRIWSSNRPYRSADGRLPSSVDMSRVDVQLTRARFRIGALSSFWLPAAFRPVEVRGVEASYDADSNSLLTKQDSASGLEYSVTSALPTFTADELQTVRPLAPEDVAAEYTSLPAEFSTAVVRLAQRAVRGGSTQYDRARALQDFFRDGSFTYDLTVQSGHSDDDLEDFLFRTRRGYCEQFAGAYAAMARAVGLPARVAVGFTPGEVDPATGDYVVHGFNAHAWPEVYLDGFGWVAFEPTPGRGMPGAEGYTGLPEQQARPGDPTSATTAPTTTTTVAGSATTVTTVPADEEAGGGALSVQDPGSPWPRRLVAAGVVLVGAPLAWVLALALLGRARRRRRRAGALTPDQRVLVAWEEVDEALARSGAGAEAWETPIEYARRVAGTTPVDATLLRRLAGLTTAAAFRAESMPDAAAEQALEAASQLERQADALVGRRARLRLLVDPRPLLPDRGHRLQVRSAEA